MWPMPGLPRTLNVLDQGNREALAIEVGFSLPSQRVVALLEELIALHGAPGSLRMDNGPEFLGARSSRGPRRMVSGSTSSSPASRPKTRSSSALTRRIAPKPSTPTSSAPWWRSAPSLRTGSPATTPSGPTTASARCRPSRFSRGSPAPSSPLMRCLLDGGAYPDSKKKVSSQSVFPFCHGPYAQWPVHHLTHCALADGILIAKRLTKAANAAAIRAR